MRLHAIHGDLANVAPKIAGAAILWFRTSFGRRYLLWQELAERYRGRLYPVLALPTNPRSQPIRDLYVDPVQPWYQAAARQRV
jgi:hypothetical protein